MTEHRIIFLDIDGVMNHNQWYKELYKLRKSNPLEYDKLYALPHSDAVDPSKVELLNQLTGAKVVISSSWDKKTIKPVLMHAGLQLPILGEIEHYEFKYNWVRRGNSIAKYLNDNYNTLALDDYFENDWVETEVTYSGSLNNLNKDYSESTKKLTYVIFDDEEDILYEQMNHFIHVNHLVGLTQNNIDKAKLLLNIK